MNKRDLIAYARFDGTGRIVPGSLVLRRNKPRNGNWHEVTTYECCNNVTITYTPADVAISDIDLELFCNGNSIGGYSSNRTSTDMASLIDILNIAFGVIGVFSAINSDTVIQLVLSGEQKKALCPIGTLTFTVFAD